MSLCSLMLFAPLLLATGDESTPVAAGGQAIVFFSRPEKRVLDEGLLLDAVAIYTRDLGLSVVRVEDPPPSFLVPATADDAVAVLRARSARLGFWYQAAPDGRSLELFTVDGRKQMTRQPFANEAAPGVDLYRAIALKIRVMVVGAEAPAPPVLTAAPSPPQPSAASPAPAAVGASATKPAAGKVSPPPPTAIAPEPVSAPATSSPATPPWLVLGAGYALSAPSGSASWRHAAALHAMASFHAPLEAEVALELAPSEDLSAPTGNLAVRDVPVRVGVRLVRRGPSSLVGLGVIAGAHLLFAHAAAPDATTDRAWTASGAGGLEFVARTGRSGGLAPELRLWVEAKVPRTRFLVRGADPRFEAGSFGAGVSVGLTFSRQ